ncbi:MAG: hypothetical protein ABH863_02730, partial [Candidatus Micrarchaeota archaeon]
MGIAEDLQEKWEGILQWSDDGNLPLRSISDALEEKGIPALPFFIFLFLVLVGGILYFTVFQGAGEGLSIFPPQKADIYLTLVDSVGQPVTDAQVVITSTSGEQISERGITNVDGEILFEGLKIGTTFEVSASDNSGNALQLEDNSFAVLASTKSVEFRLTAPSLSEYITVTVEIKGPTDPDTVHTALIGSDGFQVGATQTGLNARFASLPTNTDYTVISNAEGFLQGKITASVKERDLPLSLTLKPKERKNIGTIMVLVDDAETLKPIKDASVDITDAETGTSIYSKLKTGENGYIPTQDVKIGTKLNIVVTAKGYAAAEEEIGAEDENKVTIDMLKISEEEMKAIRVVVKDEAGGQVPNPIVKLFNSRNTKIGESNPADGIALFNEAGTEEYYITIFKVGYVPESIASARRGNTYEIKLVQATGLNTAKLKVLVENQNGDAVPQASVALFYEDDIPIGTVDKITGNDGYANYDELPLENIFVKASYQGRAGSSGIIELTSEGTGEEEGINLIRVVLNPAKGRVLVGVKDHFSGKSLENAKVEFSKSDIEFEAQDTCKTKVGKCTVNLQEGFYSVQVSADGYDTFLSGEIEVKPNIDNKFNYELVSSQIADKTKIIFNGIYNQRGESVNSLSPSAVYNAKFTITRPRVTITKAEVQVRIGNPGGLQGEVAEIIGYDAAGAYVTKGATSERPEAPIISAEVPSPSPEPTVNASLTFADEATESYKYVNFEFQPFDGSKEVSVQFRTRAVESGKVDLQYRSAFFTKDEELRDPIDETAPRNAFLANMNSKVFQISYEGRCENNICLEVHFEGNSGSAENNFEAKIAETFKLIFKLVAPKGTAVELSAPLNDQTIALTGGSSGDAKAVLKTTEDTQISALTTPVENAQGEFEINARRLANNVDFQLKVQSGEDIVSRSLSARIVGERPDLRVTYTIISEKSGGKTLKALQENKLIFTVTDSLDNPLKNAYVTVGSGMDALGGLILEGQLQEAKDGSITYVIENVNPPSVGSAEYKVIAEGFKQKKGAIPVQATSLISIDSKALSLSLNSQEEKAAPFSVQNLLSNEVRVRYSLIFQGLDVQFTDVQLELPSVNLKGSESAANSLRAKLSEELLKISNKPETINEKVQGKISISAKLGNTIQEESIPFVVTSQFTQMDFNTLWSISPETANFALQPPKTPEGEQTITVSNEGPYPILINHQSKTAGVYLEPLSAVIQPSESADFTVRAFASDAGPCRFEDEESAGNIEFIASSNGIISKRTASSRVSTSSSENCGLTDGERFTFPVAITATLPRDTQTKYNNDGSIFMLLPSGAMFVFGSGAQVTNNPNEYLSSSSVPAFTTPSRSAGSYVKIPPGVLVEVPSIYVKRNAPKQTVFYSGYDTSSVPSALLPLATSSWQVTFPFETALDFEPETEFSIDAGSRVASLDDIDIYFDATAPLVRGKSAADRRANLKANSPITVQLTPYVNSQQSLEVSFPVETVLIIQDQVRLRKDDFTGGKAIQLPNDVVISIPPDASFSNDPVVQGAGGSLASELRKITIPAGSELRVPPPYARMGLQGEMLLDLPFKIQFKIPKSSGVSVALDEFGIGAKSITTDVYEIIFTPGSTKAGLIFADDSRMIETAARAPIRIQPTDFGVVGPRRSLPIDLTINLPSSAVVKSKGGQTQIEFDNGNRMLLEGGEVVEKAFEAKEVNIPANTEIVFSANSPVSGYRMIREERSVFGTERFTIYIPAQTIYHFPTSNAALKPPNIIRNELEGYEIFFNVDRISFKKGTSGNTNDVMLAPLQSYAGVTFSGADKTLQGRDFEFIFSFPITAEIPESVFQTPVLEPYNQKRAEIYHSFKFNDVMDLKFGALDLNDEFTVRATRLMTNSYDMGSADFVSEPKTIVMPPSSLLIPRIVKEENGKFMLHGTFGKDLAFTLPTGINPDSEKGNFVNLKSCTEIRFKVGERTYSLPAIRSIEFPEDSRQLPLDLNDPEATQQIIMRAGGQVDFELCEGKARKDRSAT